MKLVGINPSEKSSTLVKSLIEYLKELGGNAIDDRCELAKGIFRKLPSYLAQESDLKNLEKIVSQAVTLLKNYSLQKQHILATSFEVEGILKSKGFLIAMGDRPFIVDSIREYFIEAKINLLCLTHPIINVQDVGNLSLSFFQIEETPNINSAKILSDLTSLLSSLVFATSDYPKMTEQLNTVIEDVKQSEDSLKQEIIAFLKWLKEDGFIFLGSNNNSSSDEDMGIIRDGKSSITSELKIALSQNIDFINSDSRLLFCSKTAIKSLIHRSDYLDIISVKSGNGTIRNFVGLFTSKARNQEASSVPILRKKLADVLIEEGLVPNSHDYKELISLADTLPKSDFLQYSKDQVRSYFQDVTNANIQGALKLIHVIDRLERFHYFTVALPRDRYSQGTVKTIESIFRSSFSTPPKDLETHAVLGDHPLVLVRTMVPFDKNSSLVRTIEELEELIMEKTISWDEKFQIHLCEEFEEAQAATLYNFYSGAFSKSYQGSHDAAQALRDLKMLEELSSEKPLNLTCEPKESHDNQNLYLLRIYKRGEGLTLSNIVPYLGNCGFEVINEIVSPIATEGAVWASIYDLYLCPKDNISISKELADNILLPALEKILLKNASNDLLNRLLINPGLGLSQIAILRALVRYLSQIKVTSSPRHAMEALVTNPDIALLISDYFEIKFNPRGSRDSMPSHDRFQNLATASQKILRTLKKVSNISYDRILSMMVQVIDATLRTNCFVSENVTNLSFKIESGKISSLPNPKPFREIFVSAPDFQGIHLRGGKIARGGLRWSSRPDDFRTEVLGLMKTQMVKNSIIVPVGAKGGFILHDEPTERKELLAKVEIPIKNSLEHY